MRIIRSPKILQREMERLRRLGKGIGFVPTMGALHEGHLSLVRAARRESNLVVVSIFVNPAQFGPKEDFRKYPRTFANDCRLLRKEKVSYLFYPSVQAVYPKFPLTPSLSPLGRGKGEGGVYVEVDSALSNVLCGRFRPGHFRGVATVVAKLFNLVRPRRAYFGAKDYQQSIVIRRIVSDLNWDIQIRVLPTVREPGGLAMSSRNRYLSSDERRRARAISGTLFWLRNAILYARRELPSLKREARRSLVAQVDQIQYLEIVDPETLQSLKKGQPQMVAATACFVGKTRLIDNVIIKPSKIFSRAHLKVTCCQ